MLVAIIRELLYCEGRKLIIVKCILVSAGPLFIALRIVVTVKARVIAEAREDGKSSLICDDGPNGGFGGSNKIRDVRIIMTTKLLCSCMGKIYVRGKLTVMRRWLQCKIY